MAETGKVKDKGKVEKFMESFKKLIQEFASPQKFKEAKLKDGTTVTYDGDMPMERMEIWVIPAEGGDNLPAPDGVHELEDGTQVEVVAGKITKVVAPAAMSTPPVATAVPETEAVAKRLIESHVKETVYSKQEVEDKLKAIADGFETYKSETEKTLSAFKSENETLTKALGEAKAETATVKANFSKFSTETLAMLKEFGGEPQVPESKKKPAEFQSEKPELKAALADQEFKKRYQN